MRMCDKRPMPTEHQATFVAIEEIYETLPLLKNSITEFGMTNGLLGLSVFCYLYGVHAKKESCFKESALHFDKALGMIGTDPVVCPLDFTELGVVSHFLWQAKVIGFQSEGFLRQIDAYLLARMRQALGQLDIGGFSSGAVGLGFYFLSRARFDPHRFSPVIYELAKGLVACSLGSHRESHWYPDESFPLALWNGQAAVIMFLTTAAERRYIEKSLVFSIMGKAINFLTCRLKMQPSSTLLSFLMGDLGAAYAILRAGQVFDNHQWRETGLEFLGKRAGFCLANAGAVKHAGMLTGASGAALAFNKIYQLTGTNLFADAAELCFDRLLWFYRQGTVDFPGQRSALCFGTGTLGVGSAMIKSLHRDQIDFDHLLWLI